MDTPDLDLAGLQLPGLTVAAVGTSTNSDRVTAEVRAVGELDVATAPQLVECLDAQLGAGAAILVVDLGGVTFCSAAGLGALIAARHRAQAARAELLLGDCSIPVLRLLALAESVGRPADLATRADRELPEGTVLLSRSPAPEAGTGSDDGPARDLEGVATAGGPAGGRSRSRARSRGPSPSVRAGAGDAPGG